VDEYGIGGDGDSVTAGAVQPGGWGDEWQSRLVERYQRRGRSVDSALLGCYLSGANGRRIGVVFLHCCGVLRFPRARFSLIVGRLEGMFSHQWREGSLKTESVVLYIWMR
jgi:transposase-like protein